MGLCGTAARKGTSGCLSLCATSARLTPVTSSRLLKGASTTAKRGCPAGQRQHVLPGALWLLPDPRPEPHAAVVLLLCT